MHMNNKTIQELQQIVEQEPLNDNAHFQLGRAYHKAGDIPNAIASYLSAVEINPNSPAKEAHAMTMRILNFYNKDMLNP